MATKEWTPRREGEIYCSPACGGGCTHKEYEQAQQSARLLCEALGKGWRPYVHENLGWHFAAHYGQGRGHHSALIEVHMRDGVYTCYLQTTPQFVYSGARSARNAVRHCLKSLAQHRTRVGLDYAEAKWALGGR